MKTLKESLLDNPKDQTRNLKADMIRQWVETHNIYNSYVIINKDFSINIKDFHYKGKGDFPEYIQFNKCTGGFTCDGCEMTTLRGCPREVIGFFRVSNNKLKNLEGGPNYVSGSYYCENNGLKSLKGSPDYVGGEFNCSHNDLYTLDHAPHRVKRTFNCRNNKLSKKEADRGLHSLNYGTFSWS